MPLWCKNESIFHFSDKNNVFDCLAARGQRPIGGDDGVQFAAPPPPAVVFKRRYRGVFKFIRGRYVGCAAAALCSLAHSQLVPASG